MRTLVMLVVMWIAGLVTLYIVMSMSGVDGWLVFAGILLTLCGPAGLLVLAREGIKAEAGYRRWRNAVWIVQLSVNEGRNQVRVDQLVSALADPVLMARYDELQERLADELERKQNGGDHSGR